MGSLNLPGTWESSSPLGCRLVPLSTAFYRPNRYQSLLPVANRKPSTFANRKGSLVEIKIDEDEEVIVEAFDAGVEAEVEDVSEEPTSPIMSHQHAAQSAWGEEADAEDKVSEAPTPASVFTHSPAGSASLNASTGAHTATPHTRKKNSFLKRQIKRASSVLPSGGVPGGAGSASSLIMQDAAFD